MRDLTPRPTCTPTRWAATSPARRSGSAWRPPRCTRRWPRRCRPARWSGKELRRARRRHAGPAGPRGRRGRRRCTPYAEALRAAFDDLAALDRPGRGAAGARRLPPRPGDAHPGRLEAARLRGRAGPAARPSAAALDSPAQGRRGHAAVLRLRRPAPARRPPGRPAARVPRRPSGQSATATPSATGYAAAGGRDPRDAAGAAAGVRDRQGRLRGGLRGPQPARPGCRSRWRRSAGSPPSERVSERHRDEHRPPADPDRRARRRDSAPGGPTRPVDEELHRLVVRRPPRPALASSARTRTTAAVTIRTLRPWATAVDRRRRRRAPRAAARALRRLGRPCCPARRCPTTGSRSPTTAPPRRVDDPYRFLPTLGEIDLHLIGEGRHEQLWDGPRRAHPRLRRPRRARCTGTSFAVWAPSAQGVRLVGDFNYWDGRGAPDARAGLDRRLGAVRPRRRRRHALQVRGARHATACGGRRPTRWRSAPRSRRRPRRSSSPPTYEWGDDDVAASGAPRPTR